ncbi:MAG TPA: hypothetical protein P5186_26575 [Candidatus Paceibacterota bacterium]|nr:hypothetical protein [Verrucomicrobiota bacterium]HRY51620.1 hypothetical protein [Candidatus Paceibacterota bacterium]HSA03803.1 hypothetical protein [Candidatus Paceibacterota bacterium]
MTDLDEFRAGSSPVGNSSVLSLISVTSVKGSGTTLYWSAVPGRSYRVQHKDNINSAAWIDLPGDIVAQNRTASKWDDSSPVSNRRFYRVVVPGR